MKDQKEAIDLDQSNPAVFTDPTL